MAGAGEALAHEQKQLMSQAWLIEALHRTKKLPDHDKLVGGKVEARKAQAQTPEEIALVMSRWRFAMAFSAAPARPLK